MLCPLDCSGAGTCDHLTGTCTCQPHRAGPGCETQLCPGIDANCVECDIRLCRACREGFALTHTNRCAPCWLIDPRCASCTAEGRCTACADPLLNSVRRSGRRRRDFPLPFDEVFRELSHNLPFASKSHLYFQEAEPFFDVGEAILVREATLRLAAQRAAHALGGNLSLHPAARRASAPLVGLAAVGERGLGLGDGLAMGEAAPSLAELGLAPGFVGGAGLPGRARSDSADAVGAPGSAAPSTLLASGFSPSWPGWKRGFWPLYEAASPAPGADAYTLLALRGQAGNSTLDALQPAEAYTNALANVTGMGPATGPLAAAEPDGRAGWAGESDSLSPAARDTRAASALLPRPPDSASQQANYRLFNDSSNRTWPLWRPLAWYESRGAVPLRDEAVACDQGAHLDRRWRCHAFPVSHAVCGHPGTLSWASPGWAVREDEGRLRVAVRRSGGGLGRVELLWWLVHNTTGAADVTAAPQYEGAGGGEAGGGARSLVMEEGVIQLSVELTVHDDALVEGNETAWLVLGLGARAGGASLGPQRVATVTVIDDDADRASAAHSMLASSAAVAALPSHPAARLAGVPAAAELAAVAGEPLVVTLHARAPPHGAQFLNGLDTTLGGVQGPALAAMDAARRAAGDDSPLRPGDGLNGSATLPTAEPRLLVPFGGHWHPGAEAGEAPGAIRFALEVWPARAGGGLGLGDARRSGGGGSGLRVSPSAAGFAAGDADGASAEAAALADSRADPWAVSEAGRAGLGPAWSDALGLGGVEGARPHSGAARTGEAGAWPWEEGEAAAAPLRAGGAHVWGRPGVPRRTADYGDGASAGWNVSMPAPSALSPAAQRLWRALLPWEPAGGGIESSGALGSPWEPADGWQGEEQVLHRRPWAFRFGAGYGQGRLLGAPVARGEVVWAGALPEAAAAALDSLQEAAASRNRALGLGPAAAGNASLTGLRALLRAGLAAPSAADAAARRLASTYAGAVRPLRAGDYELHATQCTPGGLVGEYWSNAAMLGPAAVSRVDAGVNFTWGHSGTGGGGEAAAGASGESLSARWTGRVMLPPAVADAAVSAFPTGLANAATAAAAAASLSGALSPNASSAAGMVAAAHPGWMPWWAVGPITTASSPAASPAAPAPGVLVRFFLSGGRGDQVRLFIDHRLVLDRWGHDYAGPGGRGAAGTGGLDDADAAADVLAAAESGLAATTFRSPAARAALDPLAGEGAGSRSPGGIARAPSPAVAAFGDPFSLTWAWGAPRAPANMSDAFADVVLVPGRLHSIRLDWRAAGHPHAAARLEWALPAELLPPPQSGAAAAAASPTTSSMAPSGLHRMREPFVSALYGPAGSQLATAYWDPVATADSAGAPASQASSRRLLRGAVPAGCLFSERRVLGSPVPLRVRAARAAAMPSQAVDGGARAARTALLRANGLEPDAADAAAAAVAAEAGRSGLSPWLLAHTAAAQGGCLFGGSRGCGGSSAWGSGLAWASAGSPARFTVASRDGWGNDRLDAGAADSFRVVAVAQSSLAAPPVTPAELLATAWPVPGLRTNGSGAAASGSPVASAAPGAVVWGRAQFDQRVRAHWAAWTPVQTGRHWLHVQLWTAWQAWSPLHGSPFAVTVGPGTVVAGASDVAGAGVSRPVAGEPNAVTVTARDAQLNPIPAAQPPQLGGRACRFEAVSVPDSPGAFASSDAAALVAEAAEAASLGAQPLVGAAAVVVPASPQAVEAAASAARTAAFAPLAHPTAVAAALAGAGGSLPPNSSSAAALAAYSAALAPSVAGPTTVAVRLAGSGAHLRGSPFRATVLPGPTLPAACVLSGRATAVMVAAQPNTMGLHLRDRHGNPRGAVLAEQVAGLMTVAPMGTGPDTSADPLDNAAAPAVLPLVRAEGPAADSSSTLGLRLTPTSAGVWPLSVLVDGQDVFGSPRSVTVVPGALHASSTVARGASLSRVLSGVRAYVDLECRDAANNTRAGPSSVYSDAASLSASLALLSPAPGDPARVAGAEAAAAATVVLTPLPTPQAGGQPFTPRGGSASAAATAAALGLGGEPLVSGFYRVSFAVTVAGNWSLRLTAAGADIRGSPFAVAAFPNALDAATSVVSGSGAIAQPEAPVPASSGADGAAPAAGEVHSVTILARDAWGNSVLRGGEADRIAVYRRVSPVPRSLLLDASSSADAPVTAAAVARFQPPAGAAVSGLGGSGEVVVSDSGDGNYTAHFIPADAALAHLHVRAVDAAPLDAASAWAGFGRGGIEALAGRPGGLARHVYAVAGIADSLVESALETDASLSAQTAGWWPVSETTASSTRRSAVGEDRFSASLDLADTLATAAATVGVAAMPLWVRSAPAVGALASSLQGTGLALPVPSALSAAATSSLPEFSAPNASGLDSRAQFPLLAVSNVSSPSAATSTPDFAAAGLTRPALRPAPVTQLFGSRAPRALRAAEPNGTLPHLVPSPAGWGARWEGWWRLSRPRAASASPDVAEWTVAIAASPQLRIRLRIGVPPASAPAAPLDWAEPVRVAGAAPVLESLGAAYAGLGAASRELQAAAAASAASDPHLAGPGSAAASLQTPARLGPAARLLPPWTAAAAWLDAAGGEALSGGLVSAASADRAAANGTGVWSWALASPLDSAAILSRAAAALRAADGDTAASGDDGGVPRLAVYAVTLRRTLGASASASVPRLDWLPLTVEVAAPAVGAPHALSLLVQDPPPLPSAPSPLEPAPLRPPPRHLAFSELAPPRPSPFAGSPWPTSTVPAAASPAHSVAAGSALTSASVALPTSFLVEVRDRFGNPRRVPGTGDFVAAVAFAPGTSSDELSQLRAACVASGSGPSGAALFNCSYTPARPGRYQLHVAVNPPLPDASLGAEALRQALAGPAAIDGSPFALVVSTGAPAASSTIAYGPGLAETVAGEETVFVVQPRDAEGNNRSLLVVGAPATSSAASPAGHGIVATATLVPGQPFLEPGAVPPSGLAVTASATALLHPAAALSDPALQAAAAAGSAVPAMVRVSWRPAVAGQYLVRITDSGEPIAGSPFSLQVLPAAASAARCYTAGLGIAPPDTALFPGASAAGGPVTLGEAASVGSSAAWAALSSFSVVVRDSQGNRRGGSPADNRNEGADGSGSALYRPGADDAVAVRVRGRGPSGDALAAAVVTPAAATPASRGVYTALVGFALPGALPAGSAARVDVLLLSGSAARDTAAQLGDAPRTARWQDDGGFGHGLRAEYFAQDSAGRASALERPLVLRLDRDLAAAAWPLAEGSPLWAAGAAGVRALRGAAGSVRWTGWVVAPDGGDFRFGVAQAREARVAVGAMGQLVVDRWAGPESGNASLCDAAGSSAAACTGVAAAYAGTGNSASGDAQFPAGETVRLDAGQAYELEVLWRPATAAQVAATGATNATATPSLLWAWRGTASQQAALVPVPAAALWPGASHIYGSPVSVQL